VVDVAIALPNDVDSIVGRAAGDDDCWWTHAWRKGLDELFWGVNGAHGAGRCEERRTICEVERVSIYGGDSEE
jgi:hypothetical protein